MKRYLLPLVVFLGLVLFLGRGLTLDPHEVPSPLIGKPAPEFQVAQLQQAERTIGTRDMRGKVWMLNVWASWCGACRAEHPVLLAFSRTNAIPIVGLDYKDARNDGLAWLREFGDPYQLSAFDHDGKVGIDFGVYGVPETFIVDKQGIVRLKHIGPVTQEVIDKKLLPLIRELNHA